MKAMRRAAVAAVAALTVAGCGGDDGLTKKEVATKANAICEKYAAEGKKLGQPDLTDPAKAEDYFNQAADLADKQQKELAALKPADSVKKQFDTLVSVSADATKLLGDLATASGKTDREAVAKLIQELTTVSENLDEAANDVGANSCASA
jgi:molecular chaperone GrpE (heat shock protein)